MDYHILRTSPSSPWQPLERKRMPPMDFSEFSDTAIAFDDSCFYENELRARLGYSPGMVARYEIDQAHPGWCVMITNATPVLEHAVEVPAGEAQIRFPKAALIAITHAAIERVQTLSRSSSLKGPEIGWRVVEPNSKGNAVVLPLGLLIAAVKRLEER